MRLSKKDQMVLAECYGKIIGEQDYNDPVKYGDPITNFQGLEKFATGKYGNLLPYKVEFSTRDETQVISISPILENSPESYKLQTLNILTSNGYVMFVEGMPEFEKLTLNNFKNNKTDLAEIQKLVPGFGTSGEEGAIVNHYNQIEKPASNYGL